MNTRIFSVLMLILTLIPVKTLWAQNQPSLMVIPYVKESEDIRNILETDKAKRAGVAAVSASFTERSFSPIDFEAKLKAAATNQVFTSTSAQTDLQTMIVQNSGADIYVTVDIEVDKSSSGTDVKLILKAYETASGSLLAAKTSESGRFFSDDITKLAKRSIDACVDEFLSVMQSAFVKMRQDGQTWILQLEISKESANNFKTVVGTDGNTLADELELWLGDNAYKGKYKISGSTDYLIKGSINLPHVDDQGKNYNPVRFRMAIVRFINSLGTVEASASAEGKTLYITIQ